MRMDLQKQILEYSELDYRVRLQDWYYGIIVYPYNSGLFTYTVDISSKLS